MLQFSFFWLWLLIFNIPVHQDDHQEALLWTVVLATGLLGLRTILLWPNNKDLDHD